MRLARAAALTSLLWVVPIARAQPVTLLSGGDPWVGDGRGLSVACSVDGSRAVVGSRSGGARIFVHDGREWVLEHEARGEGLGTSVAIDARGEVVVLGAMYERGSGTVHVLVRDPAGWHEEAVLAAPDGARNDRFGLAVALAGAGDRLLVSAPYDEVDGLREAGSLRLFQRGAAGWADVGRLDVVPVAASDHVGSSLAISLDGTVALVGIPGRDAAGARNAGEARVLVLDDDGAVQSSEVLDLPHEEGAIAGYAVALSGDGTRALVGAPHASAHGLRTAGAAYVFVRGNAQAWTSRASVRGEAVGAQLGYAVATASAVRLALVLGHPREGHASLVTLAGDDEPRRGTLWLAARADVGTSLAVSGDGGTALVGAPGLAVDARRGAGAAFALRLDGATPASFVLDDAPLDASARADLARSEDARATDRDLVVASIATLALGAVTLASGLVTLVGGLTAGRDCRTGLLVEACTYRPDEGLEVAGGIAMGIGAALLVAGGILFSARQQGPRHPGVVVQLGLAPGGLVVSGSF